MDDLKKKVEALLFSSGRSMSFEELKRLCRVYNDEDLKKAVQDLQIDYDNRDSSLRLIHEENTWKIQTKEDFFHIVKKVVTETELKKTLMETLAVIAWKYPIKQSDLIKIRTNKAYDHLRELEEIGYITRQKHGRSKLIKLTDKFFAYFDLPPDKLKSKFSDFNQIADAITHKEKEIEEMKEEHKKQITEAKKLQENDEEKQKQAIEDQEKEIDLIDKQGNKVELEQYNPLPEEDSPNVSNELENDDEKPQGQEQPEIKEIRTNKGNQENQIIPEKNEKDLSKNSEIILEDKEKNKYSDDLQEEQKEKQPKSDNIQDQQEKEEITDGESEEKKENNNKLTEEIKEDNTQESKEPENKEETKEKQEKSKLVDEYKPYSEESEEESKNDVSA
jgi:segregation and condensation protein B